MEGLDKQGRAGGRAAVLAWGMCAFALALIFASLVLALLGTARAVGLSAWFSGAFQIVGPIFGFVLLPLYSPNGSHPPRAGV